MNPKHTRYGLIASGALNILLLLLVLRLVADQNKGPEREVDLRSQSANETSVHRVENSDGSESAIPQPISRQADSSLPEKVAEEQRQRIMRNLTENLTDPGMNREIWNQQKIVLSDKYSRLIKQLGLNEEEAAYFLDLLTARQMLYVNVGMKQMTGALTAEELQALWQQTQVGIEPINKEIDSFLNSSRDSELMAYYERSEVERAATTTFEKKCRSIGIPLPEGSDEDLVSIIMNEQEQTGLITEFNGDLSKLTEADIVRHAEEMTALAPRIAQRASSLLNPEQLAIWENTYTEYIKNQANWLRMVRQMTQTAEYPDGAGVE